VLVAIDLDGTIDSAPEVWSVILMALRTSNIQVAIVTGWDDDTVPPEAMLAKITYLNKIGVGQECYDELVVVPHPLHEYKAQWLADHNAAVLIDNKVENVNAAPEGVLTLVPWATRIKADDTKIGPPEMTKADYLGLLS
jgi:hypothetical protein